MSFAEKALVLLLALAAFVPGCAKRQAAVDPETAQRDAELTEIYEMIRMHIKNHQRPPAQLADLQQYKVALPRGHKALEDGRYTVVWGVDDKGSNTVLAYEKDAPAQGGAVLMADGSVKKLSAEELRTALGSRG
jgi:hypothetical protein